MSFLVPVRNLSSSDKLKFCIYFYHAMQCYQSCTSFWAWWKAKIFSVIPGFQLCAKFLNIEKLFRTVSVQLLLFLQFSTVTLGESWWYMYRKFTGLQIRCILLTYIMHISSLNPIFDHLLESSHRDDSNKWSNIGFNEEITQLVTIAVHSMHLT